MPSRPAVASILVLWFATLGFAFYRDVWPRIAASGPPPIAVDLSDEASQFVPVRWQVFRGDQKVGRLSTRMTHVDADDTFLFTHQYTHLQFDFSGVRIVVPELTTTTRLTRSGALQEQTMDGRLVVQIARRQKSEPAYDVLAEGQAKVDGRVENGVFLGRCSIVSPIFTVKSDLDPVPVPSGQALNPLQPVNRIANVRPGQRWIVHEINPLEEAAAALFKEKLGAYGLRLPDRVREPLIAEVRSTEESLGWRGETVPCRVIDYRNGKARAETWVRVSDGKVLRQEAFGEGERLALEREE
ncbi:MAG: hypothetical protein JWO38_566 [Gemmataceae bacterium]|nr:hypothetical protein [Gemmataceae bacterium]